MATAPDLAEEKQKPFMRVGLLESILEESLPASLPLRFDNLQYAEVERELLIYLNMCTMRNRYTCRHMGIGQWCLSQKGDPCCTVARDTGQATELCTTQHRDETAREQI